MAGLKDIATASGVSVRTVGRVLAGRGYVRDAVRQRVLRSAQSLNYQPNRFARSLSTQKSYEVTVLLLSTDELHMAQLTGLEQALRQSDYHLNALFEPDLDDLEERYEQLVFELEKRRPDGVALIASGRPADGKLAAFLNESRIPYILLDGYGEGVDSVQINRPQGVYEATLYLAAKGRKRIAYLSAGPERPMLHAYHRARLDGYRKALNHLQREPLYLDAPDTEFSTIRDIGRALASDPTPPDAVLAYSDVVALAFLAGLHDTKVEVPQKVAVVGFDDRRAAALASPPLTTIAQPSYDVGFAGAEILLQKMAGAEPPPGGWSRSLPTRLVVRESA